MLKNYLVIAWRSLKKHKTFTFINIFGLALSMSICLVIISLVYDQFQYDSFHPKADRTFRILTYKSGDQGPFAMGYASSPLPFAQSLSDNYAVVERVALLNHSLRGEMSSSLKAFEIKGLFADPEFFNVFGFELKEGSKTESLVEPFSVVLSEKLALKLFPKGDAFGQMVSFEDHGNYKVTGITATPPGNTHIQFDALASFSSLPQLAARGLIRADYKDWENRSGNYNYVVLTDKSMRAEVETIVNQIAEDNIKLEKGDPGYDFELQAIKEIVPGRVLANELGFALPKIALILFGLLGLIVIITASINYANLSISKSLNRAKEIGIRKSTGATRAQIFTQFLVESILIATISLVAGIFIYQFLIAQVNELWIFSVIGISIQDSAGAYAFFFLFTLMIGVISGIIPSIFLSKMGVIQSLKGRVMNSNKSRSGIARHFSGKKIVMGVQFGLTFILLISIFQIRNQANYFISADYGFDQDQIYYVDFGGHDKDIIASKYGSIAGVRGLSFASHHPGVGRSYNIEMKSDQVEEPMNIYYFGVDDHYLDVMGLNLLAGTNFPKLAGETEKFTIINQKAVERLGFEDPVSAIGQTVALEDSGSRLIIVGVVEDYHWEPMMKSIAPLALRILPSEYQFVYLKIDHSSQAHMPGQFESKWLDLDSVRAFEGGFLNDEMSEYYLFFYDLGGILTFISIVALTITCLGFLGMMSFDLKTRVKEIGIRKVLGAGFGQLAMTMTKGFLIMLAITAVITIPLGTLINKFWIEQMAAYVPVTFVSILPAVLIVVVISVGIIWFEVWKNTRANPVNALRTE